MINQKKVLAIIPARGGSKGVPRKNIRDVAGKPLIAWTIEEAKKSQYIDRLILSSEDNEIISIAKQFGCDVPFVRPAELAQDQTSGIDPIIHALQEVKGYDYVVVLQATCPLRTASDIDQCIKKCIESSAKSLVSLTPAQESPYWMYRLSKESMLETFLPVEEKVNRRQDSPPLLILNGAVYVADVNFFLENKSFLTESTLGHEMPIERSLDIDTEMDLKFASLILSEKK